MTHNQSSLFNRIEEEIMHWRRKTWSFEDVGIHWDATDDYDDINSETYSYFRRFVDGLRLSNLPPSANVLDICARTGNGSVYFYEHGKINSVVCADVSFKMGRICIQRLKDAGINSFLWLPIRDYTLPFGDDSFDAVLCFETVEHFHEPARLIQDLGRITRSGGTLVLTTPNVLWEPVHALAAITRFHHSEGPHRFIPYRRLKSMVKEAGFTITTAETTVLVPGGPEFLVRLGEWIEKYTRHTLMPIVGLRRILIGRRD